MNGLQYKISNALTLHKPRTVDAALSLALMQEEMLEASNKRLSSRPREFNRPSSRPNSLYTEKSGILGPAPANEKLATDKAQSRPKWSNKYEELRAKRRANGLCMKCGETYRSQHKCPP